MSEKKMRIVFLGVCERVEQIAEYHPALPKWNILGLKNHVASLLYPMPISGIIFGFGFSGDIERGQHTLNLLDEAKKIVATFNVGMVPVSIGANGEIAENVNDDSSYREEGLSINFVDWGNANVFIPTPGRYFIQHTTSDNQEIIGKIDFLLLEAPALTAERINAIKADPNAAKQIRFKIGCKTCPSAILAYAALERKVDAEAEGWKWYQEIDPQFKCSCGNTNFDISSVKQNLSGLLGNFLSDNNAVDVLPLYEVSAFTSIRNAFAQLLSKGGKEEALQNFIENNPIVLHQFPSLKIFHKPKISIEYVADFAILTPKRELILIEIEKGTTKLLKKDGGQHSDLSHAIDQVRQWLNKIDKHRISILDDLKIESDMVASVRGVVIAGRDASYKKEHLNTLKGADVGARISFYTYDDLLAAIDSLIVRGKSKANVSQTTPEKTARKNK